MILAMISQNMFSQVTGMPASGEMNKDLRSLFANIAMPNPQPPLFYDLAGHFVDESWYVEVNYDTINTPTWATMYDEMWFAHYDTNNFERVDPMLNRAFGFGADTVIVGLIDYTFAKLVNGALSDTTYFLMDTNDSALIDNSNAPGSPYILGEVFSVAPIPEIHGSGDLIFRVDPDFLFIDPVLIPDLRKGNLLLQLNFGDGGGWHDIDISVLDNFSVQYTTGGVHALEARVKNLQLSGAVIKYSCSSISAPESEFLSIYDDYTPDESWNDLPGMDVDVFWSCTEDQGLSEPSKFIIYFHGFDAVEGRNRKKRYKKYMANTGIAELRNHGYTILMVDWKNTRESIIDNALRIPALIDKLKCNYLDPNEDYQHQFVMLGTSSGTLMARYALAWMEQNPGFSSCYTNLHHNTRLFISIDGEHQGAYVPLAFQELFNQVDDMPTFNPFIRQIYRTQLDLFNNPSSRELMVAHYTTENNGNYQAHAERQVLIDSFNNVNANNGYPEHVKMIAIGNGLFTGEHQTGVNDECVMQPGDLYLEMEQELNMNVLGFTLPIADLNLELRAIENGQDFFSLNSNFTIWDLDISWVWVQRCVPFINWPCIFIPRLEFGFVPRIQVNTTSTQDANNMIEWDVMPGSRISGSRTLGQLPEVDETPFLENFLGLNIQLGTFSGTQQTTGCPIYTIGSAGFTPFFGPGFNTSLRTQSLSFCFVPNFSAIDYLDTQAPQDHNIYSEPTAVKMANTPFDVIIGEVNGQASYPQTQKAASWVPWSHPKQDLLYPSMNRSHVRIINHLMPDTFLIDDVDGSLKARYLNREIGDEELLLDNFDLDRNAKFQAQYDITAGVEVNPLYEYPNQNASQLFVTYDTATSNFGYNLLDNGIFSNDDPFRIEMGNTAQLIAQNSITDVGMDIQGWVWQLMLPQFVCIESYSDTTVYTKRGSNKTESELSYASGLVYPNPITRGSALSLVGFPENLYNLRLCDMQGRMVLEANKTRLLNGAADIPIPINISSGIYLLQISSNSTAKTYKISVL